MCGRYSVLRSRQEHQRYFSAIADEGLSFTQHYNAAPGQQLPVVIQQDNVHRIVPMQWGYMPVQTKAITSKLRINTRLETLINNSISNESSVNNRCIIPASGFYEWEKRGNERTPYYFFSQEQELLCFAGVWRKANTTDQRKTNVFTIITTEANHQVASIHSRMPLILDSTGVNHWLSDTSATPTHLNPLQGQNIPLQFHPVSTAVNSPYKNDPSCIRAVQLRQPCLL